MYEILEMFEHMESLYEINPMPRQVDTDILSMLQGVSVATIGHLTWDGFLDHGRIAPIDISAHLVGTAVTLEMPTPDSSLLHYASGLMRPGDVLIIARNGERRHACLGGNVGLALSLAGAEGAVVDGPICDPNELRNYGFPVWSDGVSPLTTRRLGLGGRMNTQVSVAGVFVNPGDLVVADCNGVVVIPASKARELANKASAKEANGLQRVSDLRKGKKLGELSGATRIVEASFAIERGAD